MKKFASVLYKVLFDFSVSCDHYMIVSFHILFFYSGVENLLNHLVTV